MPRPPPPPPAAEPEAPRGESVKERNARLFRLIIKASNFVTLYAGGWAAIAMGILVGPYLASLLQMLDGNLQPVLVHKAWPVALTAVAAALPVPLAVRQKWDLASIATIPMLLIVAWQLRAMYLLAGVGAVRG